jgi:NADH-quinone oxidoreductase subunit F
VRQEEALKRILGERDKSLREADIRLLSDIARAMRDASICGLGQTAASAIGSGLIQLNMAR